MTMGRTNPMMILASDNSLALMGNIDYGAALYIDGTHSIVELGCQVLTISLTINDHGVRVCYCITRERTVEAYCELFDAVARLSGNRAVVKHVVVDHELALHKAIRATWSCDVHLCYFHFNPYRSEFFSITCYFFFIV